MCENVNINVSETNETINIVSSEIQEVIDINVFESTEDVTLNITEQLIQVNVNKVTAAEQIQSDWAQTDNEALDFIKNKPTIPTNTSDLINDGEDGVNPFITANDIPPVTGFVPYTGATDDVNLGTHDLTATQGTFATSGNPDTLTVNHSSGSGKALTITKGGAGEGIYVNKTSGSGNAVTIVGDLQATNLKRTGGISSEFLKADGSIDSTSYQDALVSGTNIKTINGASVLGSGDLVVSGSNIYNANGTLTGNRTVTSGGFTLTFTSNIQTGLLGVNRAFASNVGLYLKGSGTTSTTFNLLGTDSAGNNLYTFLDDGTLCVGSIGKVGTSKVQVTGNVSILGAGNFYELNNASGAGIKNNLGDFYIDAISATSSIYFRTGSSPTQRARIFSDGNFAINTNTNAGYRLDVNGTARVSGNATFGTLGTGTGMFWDNTNNRLGIGTATPTDVLDIRKNQFTTNVATTTSVLLTNSNNNGIAAYVFTSDGTTRQGGLQYNNTIGQKNLFSCTYTDIPYYFGTNNLIRLTLTATTGNVLINTTTDAGYRLDVNGTARVSGRLTALNPASMTLTSNYAAEIGFNVNGRMAFGYNVASGSIIQALFASASADLFVQPFGGSLMIGENVLPNTSASVQINSTTKGFLPPRMTTTQKNAIATPAAGLMIYDNTLNRPCFYDGTTWITL